MQGLLSCCGLLFALRRNTGGFCEQARIFRAEQFCVKLHRRFARDWRNVRSWGGAQLIEQDLRPLSK
jgi:hypothetical protein